MAEGAGKQLALRVQQSAFKDALNITFGLISNPNGESQNWGEGMMP
jgi:hypothetical protein